MIKHEVTFDNTVDYSNFLKKFDMVIGLTCTIIIKASIMNIPVIFMSTESGQTKEQIKRLIEFKESVIPPCFANQLPDATERVLQLIAKELNLNYAKNKEFAMN